MDPATGARAHLQTFVPPEPAGLQRFRTILTTPRAEVFVYTYQRRLSELFRVEGLR